MKEDPQFKNGPFCKDCVHFRLGDPLKTSENCCLSKAFIQFSPVDGSRRVLNTRDPINERWGHDSSQCGAGAQFFEPIPKEKGYPQ
jgi:hypothetical protein